MLCPSCGARNRDAAEVCFGCARHLTALTRGSVIASRFEIVDLLGKGGMGVVYRANDRLLDEMVAIKVLRHELVATAEKGHRFRSEIKLARRVSHPNVCRIHEYGQDGGVSYISMALIEGTDLRRLLAQHPHGLPRDEAFGMAIQIAEGLQAIHDVGILHRDLKAANIIVEKGGLVRLLDFGIAKDSAGGTGLTAAGEVMGTPEYMSPEQCRGEKLGFHSDVYSLGIVIYEIFTGRLPFQGDSLRATLLKQVQDPPPLEGPEAAAVPAGVVPLLRMALAKDPAQRFSSAADVAQALREAQPQTTVREARREPAAAPPSLEDRRLHSRLGISVDVVLQRTGVGGAVIQEERTVADNIGRRGARVMTAMSDVQVGDLINLREVGSGFQAQASVRHVFKPADNIQRLGLEFLNRSAPDRLVPADGETRRRLPQAGPAGDESEYEARLGPGRQTPRTIATAATLVPPPREVAAPEREPEPQPERGPEDEEIELRQADEILQMARKHVARGLYFEAIQCLEGAVELARGSRTNRAVRILLARATAKNPKWQRRAEAILQSVVEEDHGSVEARLALGEIYRAAGMWTRAEAELRRVLEIHPSHQGAAAELRSLRATRTDTGRP